MQGLIEELKNIGLTYRQCLFCIYFTGNAAEAGKQAGYKNPNECSRLLHKDTIKAGLEHVNSRKNRQSILTRQEILELYTSIARDTSASASERLRALDSLARTNGMFIDRSQVQGLFSVEHLDRLTDSELLNKVSDLISFLSSTGLTLPGPVSTGNETGQGN